MIEKIKDILKKYQIPITFIGIVSIVFGSIITVVIRDNRIADKEKEYCGKVIDKGYDPPSSGYKSQQDAQYWIVLMDQDIHKAVRVHVTPSCFYDTDKDDHVCFILSARQMEQYGNTDEYKHLK